MSLRNNSRLPYRGLTARALTWRRSLAAFWQAQPYAGRLWLSADLVWLAVLIATPIAMWTAGEETFPLLATLGVLAQTGATLLALVQGWAMGRILRTTGVIFGFTLAVEVLGAATGFPFGHYDYTAALQPQLAGVPLLIPLAWAMMIFPAWGVTETLLERRRARLGRAYPAAFAALAGLVFTAWDLFLDPQMVARGLWVWEQPGGFFGIPWANYLGWWLTAAVLSLLVRPAGLPQTPLIWIYALTWIFQTIGLGLFWGQPGPALAGFIGMGLPLWLAWREKERGAWTAAG